jgi:phytoene dehydrogenase-like protein
MKSDVVIIGGGLAGLSTGALLAKQGKRVAVIEKGNQPGGRAYAYEEKGFTFNYGPHAMYLPESGELAKVMARLGRPVPKCEYVDNNFAYWADGDRLASIGAKAHQVLTTKLFSLGERLQVVKLMLAIRGAKAEDVAPGTTWREWVDAHTGDPAVRRFAMALGTVNTYTRPAADLDAAWLLAHFKRVLFAKDYVGYMSGGWRSMYDVFIEELQANGGALITGTRIDRFEIVDGRITAAVTADARYEADAFVCTLPPQEAPDLAPGGSALHAEMQQWAGLIDVRALCMDLGFSRKVRENLALVFDIERDLYYSVHSFTTPDLAPTTGQLLHAMAYLSPEEAADEALLAARKEELVAGLDIHFPGWRDAIAVERTLPNARVVAARQTPENRKHMVPLRAASVDNLYFAGDARDISYDLSLIILAAAMEVTDAIAAAPRSGSTPPSLATV